ncbi:DNA recombination protein RmuC [Candidatus Micrarchaeota archaeon]|nr:DNA recombination protein RmuC [Candidatus Micrarchaeota archaeon]
MDVVELIIVLIILVITAVLSGIAGFYVGKDSEKKKLLSSESGAALVNINQQITEIKGKFEEIEKSRLARETAQERLQFEKDQKWKQYVEGNSKVQEEREKGWKQIIETTDKKEQERLIQLQQMLSQMGQIQKLLSGTQSRGGAGENILKGYFHDLIKSNIIETDIVVGHNLKVEFGWKLDDGKYLPIDSKCHDILDLLKELEAQDLEVQKKVKKKIQNKVSNSIQEVKKYQSLSKTCRLCVMAVPNAIYDLVPELSSYALSEGVVLTGYSNAAFIGYLISQQYNADLDKGDLKEYEHIVQDLLSIVTQIHEKTDSIEKGLRIIKNANDEICNEVSKAKKLTP